MPDAIQILVVDADPSSRQVLCDQLADYGNIQVQHADSSSRALALFQAHHPQIIITDLSLPDAAGIDLTRALCKQSPQILIAVMTAKPSNQLIIDSLKAGASDFLNKPVERDALKLVLSRFVDLVQRRQDRVFAPELIESAQLDLTLHSAGRAITPAIHAVLELIRGLVSSRELQRIELALNEVVRNAYEHGNLGITFDEKATVCEAGSFDELLSKRSEFAQKQGKRIRLHAAVSGGSLVCSVEDEGDGFDWRAMLARNPLDDLTSLNGRGLFLIARTFEKVEYNEKGNKITLTKTLF